MLVVGLELVPLVAEVDAEPSPLVELVEPVAAGVEDPADSEVPPLAGELELPRESVR